MSAADERVDSAEGERVTVRSLEPQPGLNQPRADARLARVTLQLGTTARLWWLGVHGGAGETTLTRLLVGSRAARHAWPIAASGEAPSPRVVLVARTHASGLRAAQAATVDWASGELPVRLVGLVLVADAPGRLPRPLRDLEGLVAGGAPAVWRVPWHEPWRLGESPELDSAPSAVRDLLAELDELVPDVPVGLGLANAGSTRPRPAQSPVEGAARA